MMAASNKKVQGQEPDDVEMLLAKTDIAIFERYSQLAGEAHGEFFPGILDECLRTRDAILLL